jgi:hypothetical protein
MDCSFDVVHPTRANGESKGPVWPLAQLCDKADLMGDRTVFCGVERPGGQEQR